MGWIKTSTKRQETQVPEKEFLEEYLGQLVWELNFRSLCEEYSAERVLWVQDIAITGYETERQNNRGIFARVKNWLFHFFRMDSWKK